MEIHIQLAGVELGPYSEKQVRESLAEGNLLPSDAARLEGVDTWETVTEVLAKKAASAFSKSIEPSPAQPEKPVEERPTIAATTTILPRPGAPSKDTVRVTMPQLIRAFGKKTPLDAGVTPASTPAPSTPAAPAATRPAVTRSGKTAEAAKTSLLKAVTFLSKRVESDATQASPPQAPPYSKSPPQTGPIPLPKSLESSPGLPMSVVKALPKKTVTDEKRAAPAEPAAKAPQPPGTPPAAIPKPADPKQTSRLTSTKGAPPKTETRVLMKPPVPAEPKATPPPTSPVPLPQSTESARTLPMSSIKALPKKTVPDTKTTTGKLPPTPADKPAKETSSVPAPPSSVTTTAPASALAKSASVSKSLKRTTGALPVPPKPPEKKLEPGKTSRLPAPAVPLDTGSPEKPTVKSPGMTQTMLLSVGSFLNRVRTIGPREKSSKASDAASESKPSEETGEATPGKSSNIGLYAFVAVLVLLCTGAIVYFYIQSSYSSADSLLKSLKAGDPALLEKTIDFPSIRQSLKDQMDIQIAKAGTQKIVTSDQAAVLTMIKNSIDFYVTPDSLSTLASKPDQLPKPQDSILSPTIASSIYAKLNSLPVKTQKLVSATQFVIDLDAAKLDLQFNGSGVWKLERIELKPNFQLPAAPGSTSTPTDLGSSLETPVIETYLADGNTKFQQGDWDGAIADFTQVLTIDPKQSIAYNNRGMARKAKNDLNDAISDFTQAIALDPKLAEAYDSRGDARMDQPEKDLEGAIADYTQAINLDPKMAGAFYGRGNARTVKQDYDEANTDFSQVIALDPNNANAYCNRGVVRQAKNDFDEAIADYTQALTINPKIATAYYNRGLAKLAKADMDGAIQDFNHALDIDPKMVGAYYNRGNAKNTKHDLDGAIADYNQTLVLDPKIALAYCNRGLAKQAKGDLKGALADYNETLALDPKIGVAYYNRGLIKEQMNDPDGAIADSSRALDLDPKEAQAYYNRGFAKLAKGNLDGARADLVKFCDLAPKDPYADHARLYLWLITMAQTPSGMANQELSDALQNNWNSPPDDLVSKIAGFLLDRVTEADLAAAAASSDPKKDQGQHCEVWYFAGMKRLLTGDKQTAIDDFHKCLETNQKDYCEYILAQAELQVLAPNP